MPQIFSRGDSVYQCDVCNRRSRIPSNPYGLEVVQRCIVTNTCSGKMHRVTLSKDVNNTPAITPKVTNVQDWIPRNVLFDYVQGIKAIEWVINHKLGSVPTTQVFINVDTSEGEISTETTAYTTTQVDSNTLKIKFDAPQSGIVQCVSHASQNTTNPSIPAPIPATTDIQLSNNNILTIATINDSTTIDIQARFTDPVTGIVNICEYNDVDAIPDAESPWAGAYQVRIVGKTYFVRTVIVTDPTTQTTPIVNGSLMNITINGLPINTYRDTLVLMGTPPYSVPDRVTDSYIDIATINSTLPEMYYSGGEILCSSKLIRPTYPPILVVE